MLSGSSGKHATTQPDRAETTGGTQVRYILTALFLAALWLAMSGVYTPLVMGLGLASVALVTFVLMRMARIDGDHPDMRLNPLAYLRFFAWLMVEIARSNLAVARIILSPRMGLRQHLFFTPTNQRTDVGQVTFANSITLTPGTITVETEPDRFLVHALDYDAATPGQLADMDARVAAVETRRGAP